VTGTPTTSQRVDALFALLGAAAIAVIAIVGALRYPFAVVLTLAAAVLVTLGIIAFVTSAGAFRWVGAVLALFGLVAWVWGLVDGDALGYVIGMIAADLLATMFALRALRVHPYRPEARTTRPPTKAFILMNPKSGGGKVRTFNLDGEARAMGAQVSYLEPGIDVVGTLERAVKDGADLLGAAGGDGTQAMVAEVAAKHDLPILCIPAGTRNHFALDLGLDRDDPSLALRALGDEGEEVLIDLGRVGDRPFVNNVSLGVYAEIVARPEYRDAKIQTALEVLPDVTKPGASSGLTVEASGREKVVDPQVVQVSNNPYARPEEPAPSGTRPRLDTGALGIELVAYKDAGELRQTVGHATRGTLARAKAYHSWTSERVMVTSNDGVVPAGVDGEYVELPSPLEISIRPRALRIRVPRDRPGASTAWPRFDGRIIVRMWSILRGDPDPAR
jgi:diacylglycerol kinase family enzyme